MSNEILLYLAGKIQKDHEEPNETYWTKEDQKIVREALAPLEVRFLDPSERSDDLSDQKSVLGRDMTQVFLSDAVFVDARDRRGLGVGAEMMWAKMHRIPVIALSPLGSHYHKKNTSLLGVSVEGWKHPFIEGLSDLIVESLEEGAKGLKKLLEAPKNIKGPEFLREAMQHYLLTQFSHDIPMKTLKDLSPVVENRLNEVLTQK